MQKTPFFSINFDLSDSVSRQKYSKLEYFNPECPHFYIFCKTEYPQFFYIYFVINKDFLSGFIFGRVRR
jgi:hypothetical protein